MKLAYRKLGQGKPVIILHGLFGSSDNWQTFGKQLATYGYEVILTDLRNHGLSPHASQFNYSTLASDVQQLIIEEQLDHPVVIGHSLGGKTAIKLAFEHADELGGLIVIDIALRYYPVHHRTILDALLQLDLNIIKTRGAAEEALRKNITEPGVLQFLLKNLYWKNPGQLAWRFHLEAIDRQIENVGEELQFQGLHPLRALFIKGEKSEYITYEDEKQIYNQFTNVEVITAPEAGHWVHADAPEWLLSKIVSWMKAEVK